MAKWLLEANHLSMAYGDRELWQIERLTVYDGERIGLIGERAKTALAKLLLMDCNVLLLDEPTNHLDIFTLEALEELLLSYGGTILFVSHDEAFVHHMATRTLRIGEGWITTSD